MRVIWGSETIGQLLMSGNEALRGRGSLRGVLWNRSTVWWPSPVTRRHSALE